MKSFNEEFNKSWKLFVETEYAGGGRLGTACRYALEGRGKRTRPELLYLTAKSIQPAIVLAEILPMCIAVEMIHTYSLVHDDLPIFDDDSLRRGRPTVHCAFDQATALLVGDAILTDAWTILSGDQFLQKQKNMTPSTRLKMIFELSKASGSRGMVQGQMDDLKWTGQTGFEISDLIALHQRKTGALMGASCALGVLATSNLESELEKGRNFGTKIGLAFQILDDLLDKNSDTGKTSGKDQDQGKLTFLQLLSHSDCLKYAKKLTEEAFSGIAHWGDEANDLREFAQTLLERQR